MEIAKDISLKAFVIGIVIIVVCNFMTGLGSLMLKVPFLGLGGTMGWSRYAINLISFIFGIMFFEMLILGVINWRKNIFNRKEVALIFIMTGFALSQWTYLTPGFTAMFLRAGWDAGWSFDAATFAIWQDYAPGAFWGPLDQDLLKSVVASSLPVDFAPWLPAIMWTTSFQIIYCLVVLFVMLLFIRPLASSENLSVPGTEVFTGAIEMTQSDEEKKRVPLFKNPMFWIGVAFAFIPAWPQWLRYMAGSQTTADPIYAIYAANGQYRTDYNRFFGDWGTRLWEVAPFAYENFAWLPPLTGWSFMLPFDVLATWLLSALLFFLILPPIFSSIGFFPSGPYSYWFWKCPWRSPEMGATTTLEQLNVTIPTGALLAVVIYSFWRNRASLKPIFTALITPPPKEVDDESPLPYRYCWIGFILVILAWLGVTIAAAGTSAIQIWIVSIGVLIFTCIVLGKVQAEGNFLGLPDVVYSTCYAKCWQGFAIGALGPVPTAYGEGWTAATTRPYILHNYINMQLGGHNMSFFLGGSMALYGFKLAEAYKMDKRSVLLTLVISLVVASFVAAFGWVYWLYTLAPASGSFGGAATYLFTIGGELGGAYALSSPAAFSIDPYGNMYTTTILFVVIGLGMYLIRERVGMLRWLNPIGIAWAFGYAMIWPTPNPLGFLLIGVAVQWLSVRIKGVQWYSKWIVSLGVGIMMGWGLGVILQSTFYLMHQIGWYGVPVSL